jgi:hypothetical protein
MQALVSDIVKAVINELSQVPGISTQVYSSDRILQFVQNSWSMEIEEMWWPDYMVWCRTIPLDGVTGALTLDLSGPISNIDEYGDVRIAWPDDNMGRRLTELPSDVNPGSLTGTGQLYMYPDYTVPHRPFKVWPSGSVGSVTVHARQRNKLPMIMTDTVYIDGLLLQYDAAWMYCVDDGTVPAQANKFQGMAQKRRVQMKTRYAQQPRSLDSRFPVGTDQWWSR